MDFCFTTLRCSLFIVSIFIKISSNSSNERCIAQLHKKVSIHFLRSLSFVRIFSDLYNPKGIHHPIHPRIRNLTFIPLVSLIDYIVGHVAIVLLNLDSFELYFIVVVLHFYDILH